MVVFFFVSVMCSVMSDAENENSLTLELDYDLWEGQFEFVGPNDDNCQPQGLLKPPPFLPNGTNGAKKTAAHRWCENVTDQVSNGLYCLVD